MPRELRLFLASPGDVAKERKAIKDVVDELNLTHGPAYDYRLELVRWETHSAPAAGRPQAVINADIGQYDIFLGVMWRRFGSPTGVADSGTEEEFEIAYRAWQRDPSLILMFYFSQQPFMPRRIEELDQMRQVLQFRQSLEGKALYWDYAGPRVFTGVIRKQLSIRLNRALGPAPASKAEPDPEAIRSLHEVWPRMSEATQRVLNIAYNENRLAGDGGIDTQTLFRAMRLDNEVTPITSAIEARSPDALPPKIEGPIVAQPYIVQEQPWLSGCVADSIKRLALHLPPGRKLTTADIFTDIAKHGIGGSVWRLRQHNIGPADIDQIVHDTGVSVLAT